MVEGGDARCDSVVVVSVAAAAAAAACMAFSIFTKPFSPPLLRCNDGSKGKERESAPTS